MAEAKLPDINPDGDKKKEVTLKKSLEGNNVSLSAIKEHVARNTDILNDISKTLQQALSFWVERARKEDERNRILDARAAEDAAEALRRAQQLGAGSAGAKEEDNKPLDRNLIGLVGLVAALSKLYGFDKYVRFVGFIPNTLKMVGEGFAALYKGLSTIGRGLLDIMRKAGTGQFLKGETYKTFGRFTKYLRDIADVFAKPIRWVQEAFTAIKGFGSKFEPLVNFFKSIGGFLGKILSPISAGLSKIGVFVKGFGTLLSKLAWPITIIFALIDGITGFIKKYAETGSILEGLKGAFTAIIDGFFGSFVQLVGDIFGWIFEKLGLENVANAIGDITGNLVQGISKAASGIADFLIGIFTFDGERIMAGLGDVFKGAGGIFMSLLSAPIDLAVNFLKDIFGFGDPTKPFSFADWFYGDPDGMIWKPWNWVKSVFSWEDPEGQEQSLMSIVTDSLKEVWDWLGELLDPKRIVAAMLPEPGSMAAKLIPDALYEYAGINPATGERESDQQRTVRQSSQQIEEIDSRISSLQAERNSGITNAEDPEAQVFVRDARRDAEINAEIAQLQNQRRAAAGRITSSGVQPAAPAAPAAARPAQVPRGTPAEPATTPAQQVTRATISDNLINTVKNLEGFSPTAFWDHQQWSWGYGTKAPGEGSTITQQQAERDLRARLQEDYDYVLQYGRSKGYSWNQQQAEALTSFVYNLGRGALDQVTSNGTRSNAEIAEAIPKYNKASGQVNQGLVNRRADELALFQSAPGTQAPVQVAQAPTTTTGPQQVAQTTLAEGTTGQTAQSQQQLPTTMAGLSQGLSLGLGALQTFMGSSGMGELFNGRVPTIQGAIGQGDQLDIPDFNLMGQAVNNGSERIAAAKEAKMSASPTIVSAPTNQDNSTVITNVRNETTVLSMNPRSIEPTLINAMNDMFGAAFG